MLYSYSISVPASTTKAVPSRTTLKLTAGVIHRIEIQFPGGCAGLVHVAIDRALHQVWPTNPAGDLSSDGYNIAWNEHYEVAAGDNILVVRAWNDDDTYAHTIELRLGILPADVINPPSATEGALSRFLKMVGMIR